jgi:hypothetical protein
MSALCCCVCVTCVCLQPVLPLPPPRVVSIDLRASAHDAPMLRPGTPRITPCATVSTTVQHVASRMMHVSFAHDRSDTRQHACGGMRVLERREWDRTAE